jgi:replicative DNA helicase
LNEVVTDLTTNPAYGEVYIAQVPRGATIASIEQRMYRVQRHMHIDLVVMDYLALLASDRKRQTNREELAAIMKEAKQVSTTFDGGRGVAFASPWQVTRAAREQAERIGMYTSASLSETAEATNSADGIISLLAPTDNTDRRTEVTMQLLKNRDGETANGLMVAVDYATCHFSSRTGLQFAASPTAPASALSGGFGLDSLLGSD